MIFPANVGKPIINHPQNHHKWVHKPPTYGWLMIVLPSGKRLHNDGKSQFLMAKLTINGHFQ
jgi:hypothetical protein